VRWSFRTRGYFSASFPLKDVFGALVSLSDDQLSMLFKFLWALVRPFETAWLRLPHAAFVRTFHEGFRLSRARSPAAKRAYLKLIRRGLNQWPGRSAVLSDAALVGLLAAWIRDDAVEVRLAAATAFSEISAQQFLTQAAFNGRVVDALVALLADLDRPDKAEMILACIGKLVHNAADSGAGDVVLECFERDAIWERLAELASDPDAEIGNEAVAQILDITAVREQLCHEKEKRRMEIEMRKREEIRAMRAVMTPGDDECSDDSFFLDSLDSPPAVVDGSF
jgi:hypothetical protein